MPYIKYLALLRGINVGGNNIIKMADLKLCFENMGFSDVQTYIQSGNVIFKSSEEDNRRLTANIEKTLSRQFVYLARVVVIPHLNLKRNIEEAPEGFGSEPEKYRYDVLFLKESLSSKVAMKSINPRKGVDEVYAGENILYFKRLISRISQSHLTKIISLPVYQNLTIRNWNTTYRLFELMEG